MMNPNEIDALADAVAERVAARRLLLRLLTAEGVRATRTLAELRTSDPAEPMALEALVRGRLLLAREVGGETAYELAHEALIKGWAELRRWIDGDRAALSIGSGVGTVWTQSRSIVERTTVTRRRATDH